jgi:uncharacterized protein YbcI
MSAREQETVQDRPPAGADESHGQETDAPSNESASERGLMMAAVSTAIVQIHKKCFGKGPVKARSYLVGNLLAVILEGGYSRGEQTLQENGHIREVLNSRTALQESMESEFRAAVESILYRQVRSFMSASDPLQDLQAELFILEPPDQ